MKFENDMAIVTISESKEHPALHMNHQFHLRLRLFTLSIGNQRRAVTEHMCTVFKEILWQRIFESPLTATLHFIVYVTR